MVGYYNSGVPTTVELENNRNQSKYTVNSDSDRGFLISKPLCALMVIGAILLAVLAALTIFFILPRCSEAKPDALTSSTLKDESSSYLSETDERLPRSIEPTHYSIQLIPDIENLTTSGAVTILLLVKEDTQEIIFHVNKIDINKHSVTLRSLDRNSSQIELADQAYLDGQKYSIKSKETFKKDEQYSLDIQFTSEINNQLQGFYKSHYEDHETHGSRYTISTQFSPTDARRVFPCFDEPSFKATFTISIARPSNMSTLSNMPLEKTDIYVDKNNTYWDRYPETPKMSTYLVAFMVSDLQPGSSETNNIKVWSRRSLLYQTKYAADLASKILNYFEGYFNIKFPLPKIDIVAVPEFGFNAMENWGLITFRESSLLFDDHSSTALDKRSIATILSHEIAHQWFGNLVSPKWWNDLWLKEGFATYLEYLGVNYAEPKWKIKDEFLAYETERAFASDSLMSARPISFDVRNNYQIRQTFDDISYAKGASIIRMMNHFLGEETFKKGLISFLQKYKYDNADRQDLFDSLTEEAHKSGSLGANETVKHIMDTWTEQAGYPVVTAVADYKAKKLTITQKRFLLNPEDTSTKWWVPVSLVTSNENISDTTPKFWLRNERQIVTDIDVTEWYLLNVERTGYYIVNYDEQNWRALIKHIMDIPPLIRAQLISDSMELAKANMLDYDIPLRMIANMATKDDKIMFVPTMVAFEKLKFLSDILSSTPAFGLFEQFHTTIFKRTYEIVEFDFEDNFDDYLTRRIRGAVLEWSCRSPHSVCSYKAQQAFRDFINKNQLIKPNLRSIFYCTAIREGTEMEWDFAYKRYLTTYSPSEKNVLLDSLGCTKKRWLLSRLLDIMLDDGSSIRIQDADRVFESVVKNKVGTQIAFDFLRRNWNELHSHYGDGFSILSKMIKSLASYMNTEFELADLMRFRDVVKNNITTTSEAFDYAIETVKANVGWMKKNYDSVERWLNDHRHHYELL